MAPVSNRNQKMTFPSSLLAHRMLRTQSSAVRELLKYSKMPNVISLAGGIPAPDLFDIIGLEGALDEELSERNRDTFQYGLTEGNQGCDSKLWPSCCKEGFARPPTMY